MLLQHSLFAKRYRLISCYYTTIAYQIWKAIDLKTKDTITLKIANNEQDAFSKALLLKEYLIGSQIRHPHLKTPLYYDEFNDIAYLIYQFTEEETIKNRLLSQSAQTEPESVLMMTTLADVLAHIHEQGIHHHHVYPENVFYQHGQYVLGPIWLKHMMPPTSEEQVSFCAPELFENPDAYTPACDVYSLAAVVLYALLPYDIQRYHLNKNALPDTLQPSFKKLLLTCLSDRPDERPTARQIHDYLTVNFHKVITPSAVLPLSRQDLTSPSIVFPDMGTTKRVAAVSEKENPTAHYPIAPSNNALLWKRKKQFLTIGITAIACMTLICLLSIAWRYNPPDWKGEHSPKNPRPSANPSLTKDMQADYVELPSRSLFLHHLTPDTTDYSHYESLTSVAPTPLNIDNKKYYFKLLPYREENGMYGFADKNKTQVIAAMFEDVYTFSEGKAAVKYQGKWGFIDYQGNWIITPRFDKATAFINQKAHVELDGIAFYINSSGDCIENCPD